jgi:hypothetical protein
MHRSLFGLAAVILAVAGLVHAISTASAYPSGPEVTGGEPPWVSFSDVVSPSSETTIYTVPDDRMLIVTGAVFSGSEAHLLESGTIKVIGYSNAMLYTQSGFLVQGRGSIPFAPGSTLQIQNDSGGSRYYAIQGYLAHP